MDAVEHALDRLGDLQRRCLLRLGGGCLGLQLSNLAVELGDLRIQSGVLSAEGLFVRLSVVEPVLQVALLALGHAGPGLQLGDPSGHAALGVEEARGVGQG